MNRRTFLATGSLALAGCHHRIASSPIPPDPAVDSLKLHAASHNLLFGSAVDIHLLTSNAAYADLIRQQCSIVVAENAMKWGPLRPTSTTYDFTEPDKLVAFAESNRIKVRGHNLCWHRQLPTWFAAEATPQNAQRLLTHHIQTVAGRYAGRMHSWDVVNEAVQLADGRADGLRDSPWMKLLGPEYLETAFHAARLADPEALLTYNDYGIEAEDLDSQRKRAAVLLLLRRLKARHIPIDAIGIQGHISAGKGEVYGPGLQRFLAETRSLGLQAFVTEMDVNDRALPSDISTRDTAVAQTCTAFLNPTLTDPSLRAVLTWGLTDAHTWLNSEGARPDHQPERCLPFDANNQPKQMFFAIRDAFDRRNNPAPPSAL